MEFVYIPAGTYDMGDLFDEGLDNEKPTHPVSIDAFHLGKFPVTQSQWAAVMPTNPSLFKGDSNPVEQVCWMDIESFLETLTRKNQGRYRFRLPKEAEWEYAARSGGKKERFAGGPDADVVAWYGENSDGSTHPVGQKKANGLGLFDMSGNVWEWCTDTFRDDAYSGHALKNPCFRDSGREKVIRGGGWNVDAWSVRCSRRFGFPTDYYGPALGFRIVSVAD